MDRQLGPTKLTRAELYRRYREKHRVTILAKKKERRKREYVPHPKPKLTAEQKAESRKQTTCKYYETHKERIRERQKKWRTKHPEKHAANARVHNAICSGKLVV